MVDRRVGWRYVARGMVLASSLLLLCTLSARSQAVPASVATTAAQNDPSQPQLLISPGDLLDVRVFNTPELSGKYRVSPAGMIVLPQGGEVRAAGLPPQQLAHAIEARLRDAEIMLDPHLTIFVDEYSSSGVVVTGEVMKPGIYTIPGEHSLYAALSAAGGPSLNEGSTITITHANDPEHKQVIPVTSPNFSEIQRTTIVTPGDTVFVARADVVYIVGDVGHPGAYNMPDGMQLNVLEILALSQGLNKTAALSKASIVRRTPTGAETIPLNLSNVSKGTAPDIFLQPMDILVVPRSGFKSFLEVAIPSATTAVLSAVTAALIVN